ncbi:uncharacterized protein LOC112604215 [Melanaphis sacchari]|uniref:uncharacterized protein LOC112604215 n=1 Tax=Melanaphis sacchari TaxID=742174 RepID=UPI000DC13399|nr:uncharacterized protein LOC112604215 [Melanaphis sacchari]
MNVSNEEKKSANAGNSAILVHSSINKKRRVFESGEKNMIINLYKSKIMENQHNIKFEDLMKSISKEIRIEVHSITEIVNEYLESKKIDYVKSPDRNKSCLTINKVEVFNKIAIRNKIHEFWLKREIPKFQKVLRIIKKDPDLPMVSQSSFHQLLKELNFKCTKKNQDRALTERNDIVLWRHKYITDIRRYRNEGRTIYYLEEMWMYTGDCTRDTLILQQLSTELNKSTDKVYLGAVHICSTEGFVEDGLMYFKPIKKANDYHKSINSNIFYNWFCGVLPKLKDNCIIVMEDVSYHSLKKESIPTMGWKKENIIKWLKSKNCVVDKSFVKCQLMKMVNEIKPLYDKNLIDEEAIKTNKVVLRLPPLHNELNPIELAWLMVKNDVKEYNTTCELADVQKLLDDGIQRITSDMWTNFVSHTIEKEDKLYKIDFMVDEVIDSTLDQMQTEDTSSDFSD